MIPKYISNDCSSSAEGYLFMRLKRELSDDYFILHSLILAKHEYKLQSEIDFVIVHNEGIICVEVKGGGVSCVNGEWIFTDRYGERHFRKESPFRQVSSSMYSLRRGIINHFGKNNPVVKTAYSYLVIFPDIEFQKESTEWDLKKVVDNKIRYSNLSIIINEKLKYGAAEVKRITGRNPFKLTNTQIKDLINFMRGKFELTIPLHLQIENAYERLINFSEEQYSILDAIVENKCNYISGGAGTGKTLLAIEKLRRNIRTGIKTLFLCFNKNLAYKIRKQMYLEKFSMDVVHVFNIHSLAFKILSERKFINKDNKEIDDFDYLLSLINRIKWDIEKEYIFDEIIVDEGQDLRDAKYLEFINNLLINGLVQGNWLWMEDNKQSIFLPNSGPGPESFCHNFPKYRLTTNFRNTYPVSLFTSLFTCCSLEKNIIKEGPPVIIKYYDDKDKGAEILCTVLENILEDGIMPSDIVILSRLKFEHSMIKLIKCKEKIEIEPFSIDFDNKFRIKFTTIQSFKGLESKVVIVIDIEDLTEKDFLNLYYVALTRANVQLAVIMNRNMEKILIKNTEQLADKIHEL